MVSRRSTHAGPPPPAEDMQTAALVASVFDGFVEPIPPAGARPAELVVYGTAGAGGRDLTGYLHRRADPTERRPGIVLVHGGGWAIGGPAIHRRHARELAARGWVTLNISYRLTHEAPWPACMEDVKCAIRWMRANADSIGLDPDCIVAAGGSAGGHLSAMAALTPGRLEGTGGHAEFSSAVSAAVLWYPAVELRGYEGSELSHRVEALLPGASDDELLAASPIGNVTADAPPMLMLTGDQDGATTLESIEKFHKALEAVGATTELVVFEQRGHAFDFHPADWIASFEYACRFLDEHVAPVPDPAAQPA